MTLEDKTLTCQDCGQEFIFTAGEQEYYISKMLGNEPKRCKNCRQARKDNRAPKEMHDAVCSTCGKACQVPFKPTRAVFCSDCYQKNR